MSTFKVKTMSTIFIILTLASSMFTLDGALGQNQEEDCDDQCGGPLSYFPFDNMADVIKYYGPCTYPAHKFNVSCILSSCPSLKGVCPLSSTGCVDAAALNNAVSILNTCIAKNSLVCGVNLTSTPTAQVTWTTAQLLPPEVVNGTISFNPGAGHIDHLSSARFTVAAASANEGSTVNIGIDTPNISSLASYSCAFDVAPGSFLTTLMGVIPGLKTLDARDIVSTNQLNISATVSIDLSKQPPTVTTLDDRSDLNAVFSNFVNSAGVGLEPCLVDAFNRGMNKAMKASIYISAVIQMLSTYVALGLQAAQQNCS